MNSTSTLESLSNNVRILSAAMVEKAASGHPGGAMGGADFISVLFSRYLRFDPKKPDWKNRDRFFLDPGHMSPMLYSTLAAYNFFTLKELEQFRQWGSPTHGHPERNLMRGIENTSGPLGQGHTMAVGAAIAEKFLQHRFGSWMEHKIYAFISDGGIQEEISQGAGRLAGHLGLNNLIMFYDSNSVQLSSMTATVTSEDTAAKYKAWNWHVISINGNNHQEIIAALDEAQTIDKPVIIIGKTTMGLGAVDSNGASFEGRVSTHGQPLSKGGANFEKTVENLGGNPDKPFSFFDDVIKYTQEVLKEKEKDALVRYAQEKEWRQKNTDLAKKWDLFHQTERPNIDFSQLKVSANSATRSSAGTVLSLLAQQAENVVVSSADLADSDKTDAFLKTTKPFAQNDFSGRFLQAGVSELTMAAVMVGMGLHGGIIPVCGTFFVFSDYMKPVIRLAALMEQPAIFIWTHDAFRVGEDGPTHQPVEQEAQIRLLEKLQNHSHRNSVLVLRPADSNEVLGAWKLAFDNIHTPSALILSRQNIQDLPCSSVSERIEATSKGGYIVSDCEETPDLIFLANGSEVATLYEGKELLEKETGKKVRLVSIPSEGLFRSQSKEYQDSVLIPGIPRLGLTAGLPVTLEGLVGENGKSIGLSSFGFSAPASVLDEKLGYTGENVCKNAKELL